MVMTDLIADLLTRIRNANHMRHETVEIPASKVKAAILDVLKEEGFIVDYELVKAGVANNLVVKLKYTDTNARVIKDLNSIWKPGLRSSATVQALPRVLNGLSVP